MNFLPSFSSQFELNTFEITSLISEIRGQKTPPFSRPSVAIGVYLWLDPHSSFTLKISLALEFSSVKNYTIFLELEHETDEFGNSYFRRFNNC